MNKLIHHPIYPKEIRNVSDVLDFIREDECVYFADLCFKIKAKYGDSALQVIVDNPVFFETFLRALRTEKKH